VLNNPVPTSPHDPLLTKQSVADRLGVNYHTVHRAIKNGRLKAIRVSAHAIRIRESELARYLAENEIKPGA
jgi:excisionase family DNA binding protein